MKSADKEELRGERRYRHLTSFQCNVCSRTLTCSQTGAGSVGGAGKDGQMDWETDGRVEAGMGRGQRLNLLSEFPLGSLQHQPL